MIKSIQYFLLFLVSASCLAACSSHNNAYTYGIDISSYDGDEVEFLNRKRDSLSFVICKATEGITLRDADFDSNWVRIEKHGFVRGAYHFYHSADDPLKQAEFFLKTTNNYTGVNNLLPIADIEETSIGHGEPASAIKKNILRFLEKIRSETGLTPMIYTDLNIGNQYFTDTVFQQYPLWIADYTGNDAPALPGAWKNAQWILWQRSSKYDIRSVQNDFDLFNGDIRALKAFVKQHR